MVMCSMSWYRALNNLRKAMRLVGWRGTTYVWKWSHGGHGHYRSWGPLESINFGVSLQWWRASAGYGGMIWPKSEHITLPACWRRIKRRNREFTQVLGKSRRNATTAWTKMGKWGGWEVVKSWIYVKPTRLILIEETRIMGKLNFDCKDLIWKD